MKTTTCFGLYWPSSGCLENLRASYSTFYKQGNVHYLQYPDQYYSDDVTRVIIFAL